MNRNHVRTTMLLVPLAAGLSLSLTACTKTVHATGSHATTPAAASAVLPPSNSTFCGAAHYWVIAVNGYIDSTGDLSTNLQTYVPAQDTALQKMATLAPASIKSATQAYSATMHRVDGDYAGMGWKVVPDSEASAKTQLAELQDITHTEAATQAQEVQLVNYVRVKCGQTIESDPNAK